MCAKIVEMKESTPILTALKSVCQKGLYSFHALPISSYGHSDIIPEDTDGDKICMESSITEGMFDDFFFPNNVIYESQKMTAKLYNADASFYITGGTSVANQIAITSLYGKGQRILIDKNCHQSVHFHTQSIGAQVDYIFPDLEAEEGQVHAWTFNKLRDRMLAQQSDGKEYDMLILTAQSYEGLIYDIPGILTRLLNSGIKTRKFFIDEAWGSLNYFNHDTQKLTAMNIDDLMSDYPDLEVICTHSAHKSLFCLRQASLIHCKGKVSLRKKIEIAKYRIHTTSPNYPILASLDQAQSQMEKYGKLVAEYSRELMNNFTNRIVDIPGLGRKALRRGALCGHWHIHYDPTKILLDVTGIGNVSEVKNRLLMDNIYIKRTINNNILLNFHIGINQQAVDKLINALTKMSVDLTEVKSCNYKISEKFIISYPPGVPIVFPGEVIDETVQKKLNEYKENGFLIIAA